MRQGRIGQSRVLEPPGSGSDVTRARLRSFFR